MASNYTSPRQAQGLSLTKAKSGTAPGKDLFTSLPQDHRISRDAKRRDRMRCISQLQNALVEAQDSPQPGRLLDGAQRMPHRTPNPTAYRLDDMEWLRPNVPWILHSLEI